MELWLCVFVCLCVCVRSTELRKNELWQQMLVEYESGEWDGMKGSEREWVCRDVCSEDVGKEEAEKDDATLVLLSDISFLVLFSLSFTSLL